MTTNAVPMTLDAGTIFSFSSFISGMRRLDDPFKRSEEIRKNARAEYNTNQEVVQDADVRNFANERNARERAIASTGNRFAPGVNAEAPSGSVSLASLKGFNVKA